MAWKPHPDLQQLTRVEKELKAESDRGAAIMACTMIDWAFERMLKNFLVQAAVTNELFEFNGALGPLSNRIKISYSIGLINKDECNEYNLLRKIRNEFAHKFEVKFSFNDKKVKSLCTNLSFKDPVRFKGRHPKSPREMYINSSIWMIRAILFRRQLAEDRIKEGQYIE